MRRTREALFTFPDSLPAEIVTLERQDFANDSIRNIHGHVAGCYLYWIHSYIRLEHKLYVSRGSLHHFWVPKQLPCNTRATI